MKEQPNQMPAPLEVGKKYKIKDIPNYSEALFEIPGREGAFIISDGKVDRAKIDPEGGLKVIPSASEKIDPETEVRFFGFFKDMGELDKLVVFPREDREKKQRPTLIDVEKKYGGGLGEDGLKKARQDLEEDEKKFSRWIEKSMLLVVEGTIGNSLKVVYRENSPDSRIPNINKIPDGQEEKIHYHVKWYQLEEAK
ncbi:MAG: hypothetical protein PHQ42_00150 [Patescibacteria group bacterium]|nr:hypothetical protein [Patescibacteria group bacterium]